MQVKSCDSLEHIVFEPGSQLIDIRENVFGYCRSLKCIYLPASVERLFPQCFFECTNFVHLGFAPDSRLNSIRTMVFFSCPSLKSIIIPSSVDDISGEAFGASSP
jgi:hypothetical protein